MTGRPQVNGELQGQIMAVLWKLDRGTVEQIRQALPSRYRSAYTTVQTVLNRLAERGVLTRERVGNAFEYTPAFSESDYYARSVAATLSSASAETRNSVLALLIGELSEDSVDDLRERAARVERKRGQSRQ